MFSLPRGDEDASRKESPMKAFRLPARLVALLVVAIAGGCCHPSVTAVSLSNPCEPAGIPFYLPKPLLIISKNFRYVEEAKVGLTDSAPIPNVFDDQAKYADLNARTNFQGLDSPAAAGGTDGTQHAAAPGGDGGSDKCCPLPASVSPPRLHSRGAPVVPGPETNDGLSPQTFYTYQIVFVPDLTQKYGLRIRGGVGEIRAAMNLVNGWQFTGLGPYYMKDSSTAQNILASGIAANLTGRGVADVVKSIGDLRRAATTVPGTTHAGEVPQSELAALKDRIARIERTKEQPVCTIIPDYAEIHVLEPFLLPEGTMEWREIRAFNFSRSYLSQRSQERIEMLPPPPPPPPGPVPAPAPAPQPSKRVESTVEGQPQAAVLPGKMEEDMLRTVVGSLLKVPGGRLSEGPVVPPTAPPQPAPVAGLGQTAPVSIQTAPEPRHRFLSRLADKCFHRPRVETTVISGSQSTVIPAPVVPTTPVSSQLPGAGGERTPGTPGIPPS
jgi:hypothetical protein